ncbi:MAG: hypothetical protein ACRDQ7_17990 [Haloechinothrix sp.]
MTSPATTLLHRTVAFAVAAGTLVMAFAGTADASDAALPPTVWCAQPCDYVAPEPTWTEPEPEPTAPTEAQPEPTWTQPEPEPTPTEPAAERSQPRNPGTSTPAVPPTVQPTAGRPTVGQPTAELDLTANDGARPGTESTGADDANDRAGIQAALLAGLAATLLGGGWLASAVARRLRHRMQS